MENVKPERIAAIAQVVGNAKTPVALLVCALFIVDGAIGAIALFADIDKAFKGWLLCFALAIILVIALLSFFIWFRHIGSVPAGHNYELQTSNTASAVISSGELAPKTSEPKIVEIVKSDGVTWTVSPDGRSDAYEKLRSKAKHRVSILGIAMTDLTTHVIHSLEDNAKRVNVDLAMIDPEYLRARKDVSEELGSAFDIAFIEDKAIKSYDRLKTFCEDWNSNPNNVHKFQFKVYQHLPAFGMVMIDDDEPDGEIISEIYLYNLGIRPRFELVSHKNKNRLYEAFRLEYREVWKHARCVVPPPQ